MIVRVLSMIKGLLTYLYQTQIKPGCVTCRSMGALERVPLSVLLRRTGSSVSAQGRVSDDATPTPNGATPASSTAFTARWPTVRRSVHLAAPLHYALVFLYLVSKTVRCLAASTSCESDTVAAPLSFQGALYAMVSSWHCAGALTVSCDHNK